jgi:putative ABC transport system permease protein
MMAAVWVRARAELRRRWRATVLLIVVVGLAGGAVMAAVAGARRTDSAMDRFLAWNRPMQVSVTRVDYDLVRRLPQVADADESAYLALAPSTPVGAPDPGALGSVNPFPSGHGRLLTTVERPILVRGRLPDPARPLEVAVDETLAAGRRLGPGSRLRMWAYLGRQFERPADSARLPAPAGPAFDFTVTGIVRQPSDLSPVPLQQDVIYVGVNDLYLTPAFWRAYGRTVANLGTAVAVRLHGGLASLGAFQAAVRALPGGGQAEFEVGSDAEKTAGRARRAMHVQAVALLAFAALTAVGGLLVAGQSVARQVQLDAGEQAVLRAVGMTRGQLVAVTLVRVALVGAGGALLAAALAVLASPLTPIGLARQAEVDPGLSVDVPVLALGVVAVLAAVLARAGVAAWWVTRTPGGAGGADRMPRRSSPVAERVAQAGATPSAVTGIRLALEPGRGETAAPARTAMVGVVVAVAAVAASLTFAGSLDRLAHTPALQGWNWDVVVGNPNDELDISPKGELLAQNPLVGGYTLVQQGLETLDIGGTGVPALGIRPVEGSVLPRVLAGREPRSADEIALGRATLRRLGRGVGDVVPVKGPGGWRSLRIVGTVLPPGASSDLTMSTGAVLTLDGLRAAAPDTIPTQFLVEYAPGADRRAAYASLRRDFGPTVLRAAPPDEVENLHRVSGLPFLLAALLAVLGAATLGHLLLTSVRRRRRDLAVLKTLGFFRRQVSATVAWQATTVAALALLVGLPLGVAAGRWAWLLVNNDLGSAAGPVTPALAVLAVVPVTVLVANLVAALPARSAAATRPAVVLRSE